MIEKLNVGSGDSFQCVSDAVLQHRRESGYFTLCADSFPPCRNMQAIRERTGGTVMLVAGAREVQRGAPIASLLLQHAEAIGEAW